jgi:hypothetical protein
MTTRASTRILFISCVLSGAGIQSFPRRGRWRIRAHPIFLRTQRAKDAPLELRRSPPFLPTPRVRGPRRSGVDSIGSGAAGVPRSSFEEVKTTNRAPAPRTLNTSRNVARGSGRKPSTPVITVQLNVSSGKGNASAWALVIVKQCSAIASRFASAATLTISALWSTPAARQPLLRAWRRKAPPPHPTSSK